MADLQINYDRLHELANDARTLKEHLDDDVPGLSTGISGVSSNSEAIGSSKLSSSLYKFQYAWEKPFKDSMDRLGDLATLLDSVATKFFDMDADFAQQAASVLSQQKMSDWEAKNDAYEAYLHNKDVMYQPHALYNEDGVLTEQPAVHLFQYGDGEGQTPIPEDPGERPDSSSYSTDDDGNTGQTDTTYDDNGRVTSETTKITSSSGLSYNETTTYHYDGDNENPTSATTEITHSDGTIDKTETTYETPGKQSEGKHDIKSTSETTTTDPSDDDNNSSSTTTMTQHLEYDDEGKVTHDYGYDAESVDQDGEKTTIKVVNNTGTTGDTKVVTDDDGTVREYKGNYDTDTWEQTSGPSEHEDDD